MYMFEGSTKYGKFLREVGENARNEFLFKRFHFNPRSFYTDSPKPHFCAEASPQTQSDETNLASSRAATTPKIP